MAVRLLGMGLTLLVVLGVNYWAAEDTKDRPQDSPAKSAKSEGKSEAKSEANPAGQRVDDQDAAERASPDEQAIRQLVREMEEAFNRHDAKAVVKLFSSHGEVIDAGGSVSQGHEEIAGIFEKLFERSPDIQMHVQIESIRVLGSAVAIEEGTVHRVEQPDAPEDVARYAVVYSKEHDGWKMISARDLPADAAVDDRLEQLAWLIGDWVDECDECIVTTTYRWSDNERYIVGQFHVDAADEGELNGSIHIGWDPQVKQLRSWVFDSEGGFATGLWARHEDTWIVKLNGTLADGLSTTATHRIQRTSSDRAEMASRDRVIGGMLIPDGSPVTMVRRGPDPESIGSE
ncbi:MAG: nuclear transport factor 2 family protein [Planctomycetaceae bacterium]|nr:nuclear transport factor 2 family protein [Planctomycetaceae bacterium]